MAQKQPDNQNIPVFPKFTLSFGLFSFISPVTQQSKTGRKEKKNFEVSKGVVKGF